MQLVVANYFGTASNFFVSFSSLGLADASDRTIFSNLFQRAFKLIPKAARASRCECNGVYKCASLRTTCVLLICGLDGRSILYKSLFSFIVWLDVLKNIG